MKVIIAAAGTGGHINPGIAIANKIRQENPYSEIIFIGTNRGLENDLVPRAGYELKQIEAYGLGKNIINNLKTFKGIFQARKIIKEFKPDVVIGMGGYISGPVILSAYMEKIPTMLHESNAFPGKAVKMLTKYTDVIMISFENARNYIQNAKRVVLTGTPIKIDNTIMTEERKKEILIEQNLEQGKPLILIFGGSQGAKKINEAVIDLLSQNIELEYQIILSAGGKQYDEVIKELGNRNMDISKNKNIRIYPYIYNMNELEKAADVIVCRSGATTVAEIATIGKTAIFIPLPNVSNDHQTYNAKVLADLGTAKIIKNEELNGKILDDNIKSYIKDLYRLKEIGERAKKISINDAEERIYSEIMKLINI